MPQLQSLVLTDRAATPVAHTYTPREIANGVATVQETKSTPLGSNTVSVSSRRTASGAYKVTLKGVFPVVQTETIDGIANPKIVRTAYASMEFSFSETSTLGERKNAVGLMADTLSSTQWLDTVITGLESVY